MKVTKILQLQLFLENTAITETLYQAVDALNYISQYTKEHKKFQAIQFHNAIYREIRTKFQLRGVVPRYIRETRGICQVP